VSVTLSWLDSGVSLVEAYLRLCGCVTLSEFEIQGRAPDCGFQSITDVDVMEVRLPGEILAAETASPTRTYC
jgi:hypothetical protein